MRILTMKKFVFRYSLCFILCIVVFSINATAYSIILGIKDNRIVEILENDTEISWSLYPEIDIFKQVKEGTNIKIGDIDPTIENPEIIEGVSEINLPFVFAEVILNKSQLCINCREDSLKLSFRLVYKKDDEWITIPFSSDFFIPLRHTVTNTLDVFKIVLDEGKAEITYPSLESLLMGIWVINEQDLSFIYLPKDLKEIEDISKVFDEIKKNPESYAMKAYRIKLLNPVVFMAYRKL